VTPEERAARDRLAAFLTHPGLRREVEPGDPADVIAVITGRLDMPRLYKSDLRLLLGALDRHDTVPTMVIDGPPRVHPDECSRLGHPNKIAVGEGWACHDCHTMAIGN
jgi:hypothetical protein